MDHLAICVKKGEQIIAHVSKEMSSKVHRFLRYILIEWSKEARKLIIGAVCVSLCNKAMI